MNRSRLNSGWSFGLALSALAIICCLLPQSASAQAVSGTILGVVKDSSGAVVPGASITLVNTGTGLTRTIVSDTKGEYTAPLLPTGTYTVNAEMSGFKKVSLANVHLGVDQKVKNTTGTYGNVGRNTLTGPGQFNIDMSFSKNTKFGKTELELRAEAFNILNHPQFGQPNGTIANSAVGTISAMLANPSCALCGTTERQIQLSAKLRF